MRIVAVRDGTVVGHGVCTRGFAGTVPVVALGPIAVAPPAQGNGVASALVHGLVSAADALDEPLIGLLGNPRFYERFGFVASTDSASIRPTRRGATTSRSAR